jgi:cell division protease FtsH
MRLLPNLAPFAALFANLVADLRRGACCLVSADKGWTLFLFHELQTRLRAVELRCEYIDGRPDPGEYGPPDVGVMLTAITQLRRAVRASVEGVVVVLPHLDVMATSDGGWTNISREVVPLLYEEPAVVLLGFRDPTLPLLPVVEKLFIRRFEVTHPFREPVSVVAGPADSSRPSEPTGIPPRDMQPGGEVEQPAG